MKILNIVILSIGLILLGYSTVLKPFKDYEVFQEKYMKMIDLEDKNKSELFFELRKKHLTNKFYFFDYGLILVTISLFSFYITRKNFELRSLNNKLKVSLTGFLATFSIIGALYAHLFIDYSRECFPFWADTMMIPMYYLSIFSIYLFALYLINLLGLIKNFKPNQTIKNYTFNFKNLWTYYYGLQTLITIILLAVSIYERSFLLVFGLLLLLTFYYSLLIGKSKAHQIKSKN